MRLFWIAVALATAIRLSAGPHPVGAGVIAVLAIAALLARGVRAPLRAIALLLLLVAAVDLAGWARHRRISSSFETHATEHIRHDVAAVRAELPEHEVALDQSALRIAHRNAPSPAVCGRLFAALQREAAAPGRGARILDAAGEPIAWWGEDYRAPGNRTYQFDVTNLYVTRSRPAGALTVQVFERIQNTTGRLPQFHPDDAWIVSTFLHAGFPKQEGGRFDRSCHDTRTRRCSST